MTVTRTQISALAVSYNALMEAVKENDSLGLRVWSRLVREDQNALKVFLVSPAVLDVFETA